MDNSVVCGYINVIYNRLPPAAALICMRGDHDAQVSPVQSTTFSRTHLYSSLVLFMCPKGISASAFSRNKFSNVLEVLDQVLGQSFACLSVCPFKLFNHKGVWGFFLLSTQNKQVCFYLFSLGFI